MASKEDLVIRELEKVIDELHEESPDFDMALAMLLQIGDLLKATKTLQDVCSECEWAGGQHSQSCTMMR